MQNPLHQVNLQLLMQVRYSLRKVNTKEREDLGHLEKLDMQLYQLPNQVLLHNIIGAARNTIGRPSKEDKCNKCGKLWRWAKVGRGGKVLASHGHAQGNVGSIYYTASPEPIKIPVK